MSEKDPRVKVLAHLIHDARLYAGYSAADCAQVLRMSPADYEKVEQGEQSLSLPDLEVLALYLKVPMGYFWGSEALSVKPHVDYLNLVSLRHRVIGVLLRQLRLKEKRSAQDMAEQLRVPVTRVEAYESGEMPIPFVHLEILSRYLNVTVGHFVDTDRGPLRRHEVEMRLLKQFNQLSPDMQEFVSNSRNTIFLETARRLSLMDVKQLREIAESILEITW